MKAANRRGSSWVRPVCVVGVYVAACGAPEGAEWDRAGVEGSSFGTSKQALTWENLSLNPGWYAINDSTPGVTIDNHGVLRFRGAIAGTSSAGIAPFSLPAGYIPNPGSGGDSFRVRVVMSGNAGGTLSFVLNAAQNGLDTFLIEDGGTDPGAGRNLTSLDGIAVDMTSVAATVIVPAGPANEYGWSGIYSFRNQGAEPPASGKVVDGFVRLQGLLTRGSSSTDLRLFTLPPNLRPSTAAYVPVALHDCSPTSWDGTYGRLSIATNGRVSVQVPSGQAVHANCGTSLENVSFAVSGTSSALSLRGTWAPYSTRPVRVRDDGAGLIRFEGAVRGGSDVEVARLPIPMRPSRRVWVAVDSGYAAKARLRIEADGYVRIDPSVLPTASTFLSLDGASFVK